MADAQNITKVGDGMSAATAEWARWQQAEWPGFGGAKVQYSDMSKAGITADYRTIRNWREGLLPGWRHIPDLARAYGWDLIDRLFEPVIGLSRLESLENEIDARRADLEAREARLARLRPLASARPVSGRSGDGGAGTGAPLMGSQTNGGA